MKRLKVILSLFWLGVLLFALSGKTVHVWFEHEHDHDFVCTEKSTHVHQQEHHCFICDFELQVSDGSSPQPSVVAYVIYQQEVEQLPADAFISASSKFNFTLRGPPVA